MMWRKKNNNWRENMADTKKTFDKEEFKKSIISNCKTLYRKNFDERIVKTSQV